MHARHVPAQDGVSIAQSGIRGDDAVVASGDCHHRTTVVGVRLEPRAVSGGQLTGKGKEINQPHTNLLRKVKEYSAGRFLKRAFWRNRRTGQPPLSGTKHIISQLC